MEDRLFRSLWPALLSLSLLLSACGGVSVWPFGGEKVRERSRTPANASEYQCSGGKRFYLRYLDNGSAAWVILAEREIRLDKTAAANRYTNGIAVLEISGNAATLEDGPANAYSGCNKLGN